MLEDPSYGWARWDLPNFRDRISYIDDFPFMLLESLIEYFETGREQEVRFDAEGWHYFFKFDENVVVEGKVLYDSVEEFAADLIHDLEKDLHGWADFPSRRDSDYVRMAKIVGIGASVADTLYTVPSYPKEVLHKLYLHFTTLFDKFQ